MKNLYRIISFVLILAAAGAAFADNSSSNGTSVERYALYVASNKGGDGRETLKYAGSDAESLAKTMIEVGGVKKQNSFILVDSTKEEIEGAFDNITSIIERNKNKAKRVEFLFYYSGHSDEEALLLGDERFDYSTLKADITNVPSDVHVVMLDSCFSGNFIRAKGGARQQSFLVDDSSVVQGHAYLSSSSESESSQESDLIGASYFTHSLVSGLRGAADTSGDNRVSLNELYYYAFNDTLSNTETSVIGPQHPSFNITLVGSGDLVLTDLSAAEAMIILPAEAEGRYLVRTMEGKLASEVNKIRGSQLSIALPAGYYTVTVVTGTSTGQVNLKLTAGNSFTLKSDGITQIPLSTGVARGNSTGSNRGQTDSYYEGYVYTVNPAATYGGDADYSSVTAQSFSGNNVSTSRIFGLSGDSYAEVSTGSYNGTGTLYTKTNGTVYEDNITYEPFMLTFFPGLSVPSGNFSSSAILSLSPFIAKNENIRGLQLSSFIGIVNNQMNGLQLSGFMSKTSGPSNGIQASGYLNFAKSDFSGIQVAGFGNYTSGNYDGFQLAGFMNKVSGSVDGCQIAGFMNIAGDVKGSQIGFINIAESCTGVSLGLFNFIKNGINHNSFYKENDMYGIQYQGGTKYFFDTFLVNFNPDKDYFVLGYGIGTRAGGDFLCFDFELLGKLICDTKHIDTTWSSWEEEFNNTPEYLQEAKVDELTARAFWDAQDYFYPSARVTCNMMFAKHFGIFCSFNADLKVGGWNTKAFDYWTTDNAPVDCTLFGNNCSVRTYWTFGFKF